MLTRSITFIVPTGLVQGRMRHTRTVLQDKYHELSESLLLLCREVSLPGDSPVQNCSDSRLSALSHERPVRVKRPELLSK